MKLTKIKLVSQIQIAREVRFKFIDTFLSNSYMLEYCECNPNSQAFDLFSSSNSDTSAAFFLGTESRRTRRVRWFR